MQLHLLSQNRVCRGNRTFTGLHTQARNLVLGANVILNSYDTGIVWSHGRILAGCQGILLPFYCQHPKPTLTWSSCDPSQIGTKSCEMSKKLINSLSPFSQQLSVSLNPLPGPCPSCIASQLGHTALIRTSACCLDVLAQVMVKGGVTMLWTPFSSVGKSDIATPWTTILTLAHSGDTMSPLVTTNHAT